MYGQCLPVKPMQCGGRALAPAIVNQPNQRLFAKSCHSRLHLANKPVIYRCGNSEYFKRLKNLV